MNSQYKWPFVCVGALAGGWLIGYVMGGKSDPNAAGANGGKSPPTLVPSGGRDPQVAKGTADDEKQAGQHLLSVMRDPNYKIGRAHV